VSKKNGKTSLKHRQRTCKDLTCFEQNRKSSERKKMAI